MKLIINKNFYVFLCLVLVINLINCRRKAHDENGVLNCGNTKPIPESDDYKLLYPGDLCSPMTLAVENAKTQVEESIKLFDEPGEVGSLVLFNFAKFLKRFASLSHTIYDKVTHSAIADKGYNRAVYGGVIDYQKKIDKEVEEYKKKNIEMDKETLAKNIEELSAKSAIQHIKDVASRVKNKFRLNQAKKDSSIPPPTVSMSAFAFAFAGDIGGHIFDYVSEVDSKFKKLQEELKDSELCPIDGSNEVIVENILDPKTGDVILSEISLSEKSKNLFNKKQNLSKFLFGLMKIAYKYNKEKDFEKRSELDKNAKISLKLCDANFLSKDYFKKIFSIKSKIGGNELVRCLKKRQRGMINAKGNNPIRCGLLQRYQTSAEPNDKKLCAAWPIQFLPENMVKLNQEDVKGINEPLAGHFSGTILENLHVADLILKNNQKELDDPFLWVETKDKTKLNTGFRKCKAAFSAAILLGVGYHSACEVRPTIEAYLGEKSIIDVRPLLEDEDEGSAIKIEEIKEENIKKVFKCNNGDTQYIVDLFNACKDAKWPKKKNLKKMKK